MVDPDKIAISGCSAGGQLASLVALTNGVEKMEGKQGWEEYSNEVQALVDIDGAINFMAPLSLKSPRRPDSPDAYWLGGTFTEVPAIWKKFPLDIGLIIILFQPYFSIADSPVFMQVRPKWWRCWKIMVFTMKYMNLM